MTHLLLEVAVGTSELVNYKFDLNKPYAGCGICGEVYQTDLDRAGDDPFYAFTKRTEWRNAHARTHSDNEHRLLKNSGLLALPEAAQRLASYGIIPLTDSVKNDEVPIALLESPRAPINDATGS